MKSKTNIPINVNQTFCLIWKIMINKMTIVIRSIISFCYCYYSITNSIISSRLVYYLVQKVKNYYLVVNFIVVLMANQRMPFAFVNNHYYFCKLHCTTSPHHIFQSHHNRVTKVNFFLQLNAYYQMMFQSKFLFPFLNVRA